MDFSFQALVQQHNSQMEFAFRSLVTTIVRNSKLSISLLRISNVTEDSFLVSLEARITKTGPATATITPMTLELCGPAGQFGKVTLPAITTQAHGTDIVVTHQLVKIVDEEALKAFVQDIIKCGSVILSLRNGQTSITALGIGPREIIYEKELELPGMKGPVVSVRGASVLQNPQLSGSRSSASFMASNAAPLTSSPTTASISSITGLGNSGNAVSVVLHVVNPSPLEISFGTCFFDIRNHEGKLVAELKGRLDIRRNNFEATFQGNVNNAVAAKFAADMNEAASTDSKRTNERNKSQPLEARLVGKRCAGAGWCDETIKGIDVPLQNVDRLFSALGIDANTQGRDEKRSSFSRLSRLIMR